jgi:hypothetical protein
MPLIKLFHPRDLENERARAVSFPGYRSLAFIKLLKAITGGEIN